MDENLPSEVGNDQSPRKFATQELFLCVTLVSAGIAWYAMLFKFDPLLWVYFWPFLWLAISIGGAFFGAGVGALFREELQGAFIGAAVFALLTFVVGFIGILIIAK